MSEHKKTPAGQTGANNNNLLVDTNHSSTSADNGNTANVEQSCDIINSPHDVAAVAEKYSAPYRELAEQINQLRDENAVMKHTLRFVLAATFGTDGLQQAGISAKKFPAPVFVTHQLREAWKLAQRMEAGGSNE